MEMWAPQAQQHVDLPMGSLQYFPGDSSEQGQQGFQVRFLRQWCDRIQAKSTDLMTSPISVNYLEIILCRLLPQVLGVHDLQEACVGRPSQSELSPIAVSDVVCVWSWVH